jgi:hypothetical protein
MSDATKLQASALGYEKCERLLNNPDVLWFLQEAISRPREAKEKELRDLGTARDAREIAAHVRDALEHAEQFLTRRRDIYYRDLPKPHQST